MYKCLSCGNTFNSKKGCKSRTPKYCSKGCYSESLRIHKKCKLCGEEIINKHSASMKNRIYCSKDCQSKARKGEKLSKAWCEALSEGRKNSEKCKGENLYNWKGGESTAKERSNNANKNRYYKKKGLGKLDYIYLEKLKEFQNGKCFYCGNKFKNDKDTHIEHLIPITRGGTNDWQNLVYSCQHCNSTKHTKTLAEFAIKNIRPDWLNNMIQYKAKKEIQ